MGMGHLLVTEINSFISIICLNAHIKQYHPCPPISLLIFYTMLIPIRVYISWWVVSLLRPSGDLN